MHIKVIQICSIWAQWYPGACIRIPLCTATPLASSMQKQNSLRTRRKHLRLHTVQNFPGSQWEGESRNLSRRGWPVLEVQIEVCRFCCYLGRPTQQKSWRGDALVYLRPLEVLSELADLEENPQWAGLLTGPCVGKGLALHLGSSALNFSFISNLEKTRVV